MPPLRRTAARLLRTVNNRQHATEQDHDLDHDMTSDSSSSQAQLPPPSSATKHDVNELEPEAGEDEADVMRDPESSEDELQQDGPTVSDLQKLSRAANVSRRSTKRRSDSEGDGQQASQSKKQKTRPTFKQMEMPRFDSDSEGDIFPDKSSSTRTPASSNVAMRGTVRKQPEFAGKESTLRSSQSRPQKTSKPHKYGSQSTQVKATPQSAFRQLSPVQMKKAQATETAKFKDIEGIGIFSSSLEEVQTSPYSSPLSSPPSEFDNVEILDLSGPPIFRVRCEVCQSLVSQAMREDFEDRYNDGKPLTLARQRAFCSYHRRLDAQETWHQRGYPEIDWRSEHFEARLRQQHPRLIKILQEEEDSIFRDQLAAQIAGRLDRTMHSAMSSLQGISTGYYGPRGQKIMLEHISTQLSDQLREASTKNRLIGSAGVGGGVSGFVQSVLVPELALGLIAEDMKCSLQEAMVVMDQSKALGEVLCDEIRERVVETDANDPI